MLIYMNYDVELYIIINGHMVNKTQNKNQQHFFLAAGPDDEFIDLS